MARVVQEFCPALSHKTTEPVASDLHSPNDRSAIRNRNQQASSRLEDSGKLRQASDWIGYVFQNAGAENSVKEIVVERKPSDIADLYETDSLRIFVSAGGMSCHRNHFGSSIDTENAATLRRQPARKRPRPTTCVEPQAAGDFNTIQAFQQDRLAELKCALTITAFPSTRERSMISNSIRSELCLDCAHRSPCSCNS